MSSILNEIVTLLTSGITGLATGIGSGLQEIVKAVFITGTGTSSDPYALSVYGATVIIFAGIGLCVGLTRRIVSWVSSLGN